MVYKRYILPIRWLYATYHLLREPGNSIETLNVQSSSQVLVRSVDPQRLPKATKWQAAWLWKFQTRVWSKFYFKFQRLSGQFMKWTSIDLYFELGFEAKQFKSYWLVGQWDGRSWGHWCKCCWNDLFLYRAALDLWESDLSLFRTALKTSGSSLIMDP